METRKSVDFKVYLGKTKNNNRNVFLGGFKWQCGWYWGGGNISGSDFLGHFNGCFLDTVDVRGHPLGNFVSPWDKDCSNAVTIHNGVSAWENLDVFLEDAQFNIKEWWYIKDLYQQFYTYRNCAEVYHRGGGIASVPDNLKNNKMSEKINDTIENVLIPEIIKALKVK